MKTITSFKITIYVDGDEEAMDVGKRIKRFLKRLEKETSVGADLEWHRQPRYRDVLAPFTSIDEK